MDTTLSVLIDPFCGYQRDRGQEPRARRWYRSLLESFATFLGEGSGASDLTLDNGRAFVLAYRRRVWR
jgi:hypothetical protein